MTVHSADYEYGCTYTGWGPQPAITFKDVIDVLFTRVLLGGCELKTGEFIPQGEEHKEDCESLQIHFRTEKKILKIQIFSPGSCRSIR